MLYKNVTIDEQDLWLDSWPMNRTVVGLIPHHVIYF